MDVHSDFAGGCHSHTTFRMSSQRTRGIGLFSRPKFDVQVFLGTVRSPRTIIPWMGFNVYDDPSRAASYAQLEFPGTYGLAFRDLPDIIRTHVAGGSRALDFGCGAGRSTRFLGQLGFQATGIDISESMIACARASDPAGNYVHVIDGDYSALTEAGFDLILSTFAFDNIPGREHRVRLFRALRDLIAPSGRFVLLGSTPEIYVHEWLSFTTAQFEQNRTAKSGDEVLTVMKDVEDARPVVDVLWTHKDYVEQFAEAGWSLAAAYRPMGRASDSIPWISEVDVAPWVIYVVEPSPITTL